MFGQHGGLRALGAHLADRQQGGEAGNHDGNILVRTVDVAMAA
jgi:hypothetical protein